MFENNQWYQELSVNIIGDSINIPILIESLAGCTSLTFLDLSNNNCATPLELNVIKVYPPLQVDKTALPKKLDTQPLWK